MAAQLFVMVVIALSAHSVCNLQYDCGCRAPGFGGTDHCNMHEPTTPDCPWCTGGPVRLGWVGALIVAPVAAAFWFVRRRRWSPWVTVAGGLAAYAVGATIAGLVGALVTGYPTWLGLSLRG